MSDESREPWLEALLKKALDEGDVSRLEGHGKPLASLDEGRPHPLLVDVEAFVEAWRRRGSRRVSC